MAPDRDDHPLLDANDVVWWVVLGLPVVVAMLVLSALGLPWWAVVLLAVAAAALGQPLQRRYVRRAESRRPSRDGTSGR